MPFVWPLHEVLNDAYRYTPFALEKILKKAVFSNIAIKPTGGWNATLAQMLGLWVRRNPMSKRKNIFLSYMMRPVIKALLNRDTKPSEFSENTMIPGLYGIVRK